MADKKQTEYTRKYRHTARDRGEVEVRVYVPINRAPEIKELAAQMRREAKK